MLLTWTAAFSQTHAGSISNASAHNGFYFKGTVVDSVSSDPLEMVVVFISELNRWSYTDNKGSFVFNSLTAGTYSVKVQYLGYKTVNLKINLTDNIERKIPMQSESLQLTEVVVTAVENQKGATSSEIDRQAMEHIQPSGFADLLELVPGNVTQKTDMSSVNSISIRQAGSDENSSLGTAIYVDGAPISNDASLQVASNSTADLKIDDRVNVANGVDMRQISTDDIETIEIVRGVPSVRHGDLSSGAVIISRKWGATPLTARAKSDQNNKLFSIGKGFKLSDNKGIVNANAELLMFKEDPRDPLQKYTRSTTSLRYMRQINLNANKLILKTSGTYLFTLDKEKTDPELNYGLKDYYKADYSKLTLDFSSDLYFSGNFSKKISFKVSSAYTRDLLTREKIVTTTGPMPQPTAMVEGEADAIYLDQDYESHLIVEGKPLNLFSQLDYSMTVPWKATTHKISLGIEWKYDKNYGNGEQYDLTKPMFVSSSSGSGRPRSFMDIPALQKASVYLEDDIKVKIADHTLNLQPGLRVSTMPSLNDKFAMKGKLYYDPRINVSWSLPDISLGVNNVNVSFHAAIGKLTRLPVLAHLYPAQKYFNIIELNYYSQNVDLRRLYILTRIVDPTNYGIIPSDNIKKEVGTTLTFNKIRISVTLFEEETNKGFQSEDKYVSFTYDEYDASSVPSTGLTGPPDLSLFTISEKTRLSKYSFYRNSSFVNKKGIEYQISFPRIDAIKTKLTVNGAWFRTRYGNSAPEYYKPTVTINSEPYPYVGIYNKSSDSSEKDYLNTNIQADINIPEYRILFSLSLQTIWFDNSTNVYTNGIPDAYIDNYSQYHEFTEADKSDPILSYLVRSYQAYFFKKSIKPIDCGLNLKLSKEIGDNLRFSFYVNSILNYLPDYKSNYGAIITRTRQPYFGMELNLSI